MNDKEIVRFVCKSCEIHFYMDETEKDYAYFCPNCKSDDIVEEY
jgi:predicted RNA-binding Zn-ribbon protein involved in translation (DUF1610 family)